MDMQQKDYVLKQGSVREELVWGPRRKGGEGRKGRVGGGGGRKGIRASTREGDWEGTSPRVCLTSGDMDYDLI